MSGLILAGTAEARELCAVAHKQHIDAIASLAGETRRPAELGLTTRIGGFGGEQGFIEYFKNIEGSWVVDATHPFAAHMSRRTHRICARLGVPYLRLERPAWTPIAGLDWVAIDAVQDLLSELSGGENLFVATGRKTLDDYDKFDAQRLYCRVIDPPLSAFPFVNGAYVVGRPPFSIEDEMALFERLKINWLVLKNSGGSDGYAKLVAAQRLHIKIAMVNRPPALDCELVQTAQEALDWIAQRD